MLSGRIPGGWLLDRFVVQAAYFWSIFIWSVFHPVCGVLSISLVVSALCRPLYASFLVGAESRFFSGQQSHYLRRFPARERVAIFNSAPYAQLFRADYGLALTHSGLVACLLTGRVRDHHQLYLVESYPPDK